MEISYTCDASVGREGMAKVRRIYCIEELARLGRVKEGMSDGGEEVTERDTLIQFVRLGRMRDCEVTRECVS